MSLPENPLLRVLSVLVLLIGGVFGVGYILVMLLLISVSLKDPSRREALVTSSASDARYWTQTTNICLRNRTNALLQVRVVVARAALPLDSIWWTLPLISDAIGRAVVLRDGFAVQGLHYRLAEPALVLGTADTIVDVHYPGPLPPALVHCQRLDVRYTNKLAKNGLTSREPAFERVIQVRHLPAQPDSLHLTLYLKPGDTLALGHYRVWYDTSGLAATVPSTAPVQAGEMPPAIDVRWQDAQHRIHQHHPRLASWLKTTAPPASLTGSQQVWHYLDYPLNYATVIAR